MHVIFSNSPRDQRSTSGSALLMTLLVVVLVTIMAVSLASTVRIETPISASHTERASAGLFARMGSDIVSGVIVNETKASNLSWVSQPGALKVVTVGSSKRELKTVPLHSGAVTTAPSSPRIWTDAPDLNIRTLQTQQPLIFPDLASGDPVPMRVRWIYVRKDGTFDTSEIPLTNNTANPLVGRFAFWTDDESTRVNINTAWRRTPGQYNPAHPTQVNLNAIFNDPTGKMADALRELISPSKTLDEQPKEIHFLNKIEDTAVLSDKGVRDALEASRFEVTTANASPELDMFNEPRIVLSTKERYAPRDVNGKILKDANGIPYFIDILKDQNAEPTIGNLDMAKVDKQVNKLTDFLERKTPKPTVVDVFPVPTFSTKYGGVNRDALAHIALNIIEYVRSAESSQTFVAPIRGRQEIGGKWSTAETFNYRSVAGITRRLFITELGVWVSAVGDENQSGRYPMKWLLEVHLPKNFGLDRINLTNIDENRLYIWQKELLLASGRFYDAEGRQMKMYEMYRVDPDQVSGTGVTKDGDDVWLEAGGFAKIEINLFTTVTNPEKMRVRTVLVITPDLKDEKYLYDGSEVGSRYELCPINDQYVEFIPVQKPPEEAPLQTLQTDDPVLGGNIANWSLKPATLGAVNEGTLEKTGTVFPVQDKDGNGLIVSTGLRMPAPKGSAGNPDGRVKSVAEMGAIHTGIQPDPNYKGVSWRTLRAQNLGGYSLAKEALPDWALLDLFTVPLVDEVGPDPLAGVHRPTGGSVAGRININNRIEPFEAANPAVKRRTPLIAALQGAPIDESGATSLSEADAKAMAEKIDAYSQTKGFPYVTAGQIAEIAGIADSGESSEIFMRSILDHMTTRGSLFTVYSVGQTLMQTPSGDIKVTAEQRLKTKIERYLESNNANVIAPKMRQVEMQYVNP